MEDADPKSDDVFEAKPEAGDATEAAASDHNGNEFEKKIFGPKRRPPMLGSAEKKGSAIDLDIGPPLDSTQTKNYRTIQQILIR